MSRREPRWFGRTDPSGRGDPQRRARRRRRRGVAAVADPGLRALWLDDPDAAPAASGSTRSTPAAAWCGRGGVRATRPTLHRRRSCCRPCSVAAPRGRHRDARIRARRGLGGLGSAGGPGGRRPGCACAATGGTPACSASSCCSWPPVSASSLTLTGRRPGRRRPRAEPRRPVRGAGRSDPRRSCGPWPRTAPVTATALPAACRSAARRWPSTWGCCGTRAGGGRSRGETRFVAVSAPLDDLAAWAEQAGRRWDDRLARLRRHLG